MTDWRPTANLAMLQLRAVLLQKIRAFFDARGVLEVETPALSQAGTTDWHLASFPVAQAEGGERYLHTSPEFAMKRLLAAGTGDIWQACKVFRVGETGRLHNPEFTLIEWYRLGVDWQRLMHEVAELVQALLPRLDPRPEFLSYREAFLRHAGFDPFTADVEDCLRALPASEGALPGPADLDFDGWLDWVAGSRVYPALGQERLTFVYDYPPSQAALARIRAEEPPVAERFEVFVAGIELGNGFQELTDPAEQRRRFEADLRMRAERALKPIPMDERLIHALEQGLPECSGVALGFDRLVMLAAGVAAIDCVIPFPFERA